MPSAMSSSSKAMELLFQGQVITWRFLALVVTTLVMVAILHIVHPMIINLWWKPRRFRRIMEEQGWKGPKTSHILAGNMIEVFQFRDQEMLKDVGIRNSDIEARVCPFYALYSQRYGNKFFYSQGPHFRIVVTDPNLVKEIFVSNKLYYKTPTHCKIKDAFFGEGLFTMNGKDWVVRRRIMDRAFRFEALKGMVSTMAKATTLVLDTWEQKVQDGGGSIELEIHNEMNIITSNVMAHTTFGNHYKEAQQMFERMETLVQIFIQALRDPLFFIPGYSLLPNATNREISKLNRENEKILKQVILFRQEQARANKSSCANDILELMMSTSNNDNLKDVDGTACQLSIQDVVDECKTLFLAGYATTSTFLSWTMLLLAEYSEWQERARIEILEVCGLNNDMDVAKLNQMKIVGMILNEVHRLFPIIPQLSKVATKDMQLGDTFVPKGLVVEVPVFHMHHDPKLWGEDVMEFNPYRFAEGVSKACQHPQGFMPFSFGPQSCLGQNFAMLESKVVVATVLSRFQLSVSPNYKHCPYNPFLHTPKYGVQLIIKSLTTGPTS